MPRTTTALAGEKQRRNRNVGVRRHRGARFAEVGPLKSHRIMEVTTVAYRFLKPGRVVRAEIPFREGGGSKVRPAVVVAVNGHSITVIPLTTSPKARFSTDIPVVDLRAAGLHRETKARTGCLVVIDRSMAIEELGFLSDRDRVSILLADGEAA